MAVVQLDHGGKYARVSVGAGLYVVTALPTGRTLVPMLEVMHQGDSHSRAMKALEVVRAGGRDAQAWTLDREAPRGRWVGLHTLGRLPAVRAAHGDSCQEVPDAKSPVAAEPPMCGVPNPHGARVVCEGSPDHAGVHHAWVSYGSTSVEVSWS